MLVQSAMEGADKLLVGREYYLNKDYKIIKEKCKGGEPALLPTNIVNLKGKKYRKLRKKLKR